MSKAVKRVLSVAAVVAIPFAAPALAGSAFFAPLVAKMGATGASSLIGAGIGAAGAKLGDRDVLTGAALGAVGGAASGYSKAMEARQATEAAQAAGASAGVNVGGVADAGLEATNALAPVGMGPTPQAAVPGYGPSFSEALRSVPAEVAARFRDPRTMADMTLRAAGMLAGSVAAGDGLTSDERKLLQAQRRDLEEARRGNQELFRARLDEAQKLIGESAYFDPEYFGLQSARRAQMAGGQAKTAGLRGMTGDRRRVAERQYDLGTARNTGTAYDSGYMSGVQGRLQTRAAGLAAFPNAFPQAQGYESLMNAYGMGNQRKRQTQQDIGAFLDPVLNPGRDKRTEDYPEDEPQRGA